MKSVSEEKTTMIERVERAGTVKSCEQRGEVHNDQRRNKKI